MQSEKMVKQPWKRGLALLLAVLCLLSSVLLAASALTESDSGHWEVLGYYGSGANWKYDFRDGTGKKDWGLQHTDPYADAEKLCFHTSAGHNLAYCMEMGSGVHQHANVTVWSNFAGNLHNAANLTRGQKKTYIERAFFYGYSGGAARYGHTTDEERYATQLMIWMIASGDNDPDCDSKIADNSVFNQYSTSLNDRENGFVNKCTINVPSASKSAIIDTLRKMKEQMVTHETIPSFMTAHKDSASTKIRQLSYNPATGFYENVTRLPDDHGVISYYESATDGVIFKINDNVLTIQTKKIIPANAPLTITAERKRAKYSNPVYLKVGGWSKVAGQIGCAAITGHTDPVRAYMSIWTNSTGNLKITKTSSILAGDPALSVSGIQFRVTGPNGFDKTVTTGTDGTFTLTNIAAGTYTVTELNVKNYWWPQSAKTVTVTSDATASVSFQNGYKYGHVDVTKTAEDGLAKGTKFHLYGTADCGAKVDRTETVGDDGQAHFSNVLIGKYTLEEVDVPVRYVVPSSQNVTVEWDKHTTPTFENKLIKANLKIIKKDADTNQPIVGAQFKLYETQGYDAKNPPGTAKLVASAVTDASGELTFKNIRYGPYILRETQAPTGYVLDRWLSAGILILLMEDMTNLSFQNGTFTYEATNEMIRGHLKIVKKDAAAVTIPLEGAGFRVYSAAKDNVSGEEVSREGYTNAYGEITFRDLPYGKYTYQEIEAPKGYQLDETVYDFNIAEQGVTITKNAFNRRLPGSISVHKTDDSGKPLAGVKFLLEFSTDGKTWMPVQRAPILSGSANVVPGGCTSPGLQNGVLVTDEDGNAVFSGLFTSIGTSRTLYRLTELETLDGYQLLSEPVFEGALKIGEEIDVSFTVVNTHTYALPPTGSIGYCLMTVVAGVFAVGAIGCAVVLCKKRRKIY